MISFANQVDHFRSATFGIQGVRMRAYPGL